MKLYENYYTNKNILNDTKPILKKFLSLQTTIVCIGSDKIILDCLGPLIGSMLKNSTNLNIVGDLFNPVNAKNINDTCSLYNLNQQNVLVIDCCISAEQNDVNKIYIYDEPAFPGGLQSNKSPVGTCKIIASVNHSNNPYIYNNSTSLSHIYKLAETITNIIINATTGDYNGS